ncbi:MAG: methyltransferase domain-containing protein [Clostridia bacterium]|nr:methyltransferase domain-containing protein [Clostridia bacterium]
MDIKLKCPVCGRELTDNGKTLSCEKNHSFDRARQGYVNLLPVQFKHSLDPGDTAEMLKARRRFLDSGKYEPICRSVLQAMRKFAPENPKVLDIGCGEGYYTSKLKDEFPGEYMGIDISKDGARMACSRDKDIFFIVATASHIPVADNQFDCLCAMFSLLLPEEYARVLKQNGCVVEVTVGNDHLKELKNIIYDEVFFKNKHYSDCTGFFDEVQRSEYRYRITLDNAALKDLLLMTPHFWRIRKERREQLEATDSLTLTVDYWVRVLKKK